MVLTLDVHRAYARIEPKHAERARRLEESLDTLLALGRDCASGLLQEIKPAIAVSLK